MTIASLIALEERERIEAIEERGRWVDMGEIMRAAFWSKEGLKFDRESWERSLAAVPAWSDTEMQQPGKLTTPQRDIMTRILASFLPKPAEIS